MDRKMTTCGFTLVELMMVLVVIGILLAVSIFRFTQVSRAAGISEDIHDITTFLKSRRMDAFTSKQKIDIVVSGDGTSIRAIRDPDGTPTPAASISLKFPLVTSRPTFSINSRGLFSTTGSIRLAAVNSFAAYSCISISAERIRQGVIHGASCNTK